MYSWHNSKCKITGKSLKTVISLTLHDLSHVQRSLCMRKVNQGLQGCQNKLPVNKNVCVSLAVSCMRVLLAEFPRHIIA